MFDRILLAIDDSPASEVATAFTIAFANRCSASVHVLHVNERMVGGQELTLHPREEAAELVTRAVLELRQAGLRASGSVDVASYRQVPGRIVDTAIARGADAIVLGSRRHRRLGRLFSHQVRERTIRLTALPVMTAPSPLTVKASSGLDVLNGQVEHVLASMELQ
jgi:nucleotide-binding universal stress UspA family protein